MTDQDDKNEPKRRSQFYLHTNGKVIYKPLGGVDLDSDFVVISWHVADVTQTPEHFVDFLREAFLLGADIEEIQRLANHNRIDNFHPQWKKHVFNK